MSVARAQKLMDELFRRGYEVPCLWDFPKAYGVTFLELKSGTRKGGQRSTASQTLLWVNSYVKRHGVPPLRHSGTIGESDSGNLTWRALDARLRKQGSSLYQFCVDHGLRASLDVTEATEEKILQWVRAYTQKHGKRPSEGSGLIGESDSGNLTWLALGLRLRKQGSSLFLLYVKHGLRVPKTLSKDMTLRWVGLYREEHGKDPTAKSGVIGAPDSGGLTWGALNGRLRARGSSLPQLCADFISKQ